MVVKSILGMAGKKLAQKYLSRNKSIKGLTKTKKDSDTFLSRSSTISGMPMIGKINKKSK
tara:strand:- start:67 stop:246 length:180 start_codon:yes stop_codon:yes gene_type:complete